MNNNVKTLLTVGALGITIALCTGYLVVKIVSAFQPKEEPVVVSSDADSDDIYLWREDSTVDNVIDLPDDMDVAKHLWENPDYQIEAFGHVCDDSYKYTEVTWDHYLWGCDNNPDPSLPVGEPVRYQNVDKLENELMGNYDLSLDHFPATKDYAGAPKEYNLEIMQDKLSSGLTSGQFGDLMTIGEIAETFAYAYYKDKFPWRADLDAICAKAEEIVPDIVFKMRNCSIPMNHVADAMYQGVDADWVIPSTVRATYDAKITPREVYSDATGWSDIRSAYDLHIAVYADDEELRNKWVAMSEWDPMGDNEGKQHYYDQGGSEFAEYTQYVKDDESVVKITDTYVLHNFSEGDEPPYYVIHYYDNGVELEMTCDVGSGGDLDSALSWCKELTSMGYPEKN